MQARCWYWLGGLSPGKPGAEKKQFNQSGCVYESLLGFAVSGCLWYDFCQEWVDSPGAACMEQCASVATWFFLYKTVFLPLAQNKMFQVMLKMCNAHHISWSHCCSTEQCCATCLQWDCLVICHLCDSFSTANFSAKSYQLDKWCVQSWELISSRWFYAHKFTALTNTSVLTIQPSAV